VSDISIPFRSFPRAVSRCGDVEERDRLFVTATMLATYPSFQIVEHALEPKKPVFILDTGSTRADEPPGIGKLDGDGGVLLEVVQTFL